MSGIIEKYQAGKWYPGHKNQKHHEKTGMEEKKGNIDTIHVTGGGIKGSKIESLKAKTA